MRLGRAPRRRSGHRRQAQTEMGEAACYTIQSYTPPDMPLCPVRLSARTQHGCTDPRTTVGVAPCGAAAREPAAGPAALRLIYTIW